MSDGDKLEEYIREGLKHARNDDEKMNVISYYLSLLNQKAKELQDKIRLTEAQIDELTTSLEALKQLKDKKDKQLNFNIGSGIYVPGKSVEGNMFIDIGSMYVLRTSPEEVEKITSSRLNVQVENLKMFTEEFSKTVAQIKKLNEMGRDILRKHVKI